MSTKVEFSPTRPNDIEMTFSITMTVSEWVKLKTQLTNEYPAWKLSAAISEMVEAAEVHWRGEEA